MSTQEPSDGNDQGSNEAALAPHPYVRRLRPDPTQPPQPTRVLEGLLGDSDREGYRRLYFSRDLTYYAEFQTEDALYTEPIPSRDQPLVGMDATRVYLKREAQVDYTRTQTFQPVDEFDLDVRLGTASVAASALGDNTEGVWTQCFTGCQGTCRACYVGTNTCQTRCNQATCQTCFTHCEQSTCDSCGPWRC